MLCIMLAGQAMGEMTSIPASSDVYISLGTGDERIFNATDTLVCAVNVTDVNGTRLSAYPGVPMISFDISDLNLTGDDVAILVLKAASIQEPANDSALVALLCVGSEWDEGSDYTTLLLNILPAWNIVKRNDLTQMGVNTDGDGVFAFDVSDRLVEAAESGDRISFLLEAISNSSYEVDLLSRESGQGPYLIIMPYPKSEEYIAQESNRTVSMPVSSSTDPSPTSPMSAGNASDEDNGAAASWIGDSGNISQDAGLNPNPRPAVQLGAVVNPSPV